MKLKNNHNREFWTEERRRQLCDLAALGMPASDIAALMGTSKLSVLICCKRRDIAVVMHTETETAHALAVSRESNRRKQAAWKAKERVKANLPQICVQPGTSKTSVIYRNQLPRIDDCMSKDRLRAMIAEACRNTAEMQTNAT